MALQWAQEMKYNILGSTNYLRGTESMAPTGNYREVGTTKHKKDTQK